MGMPSLDCSTQSKLLFTLNHDPCLFPIQAEPDWGEPRHFNALNKNLSDPLNNSISVIAKGDRNYRRLVQDRQWPLDTPAATAGVPFPVLA
ncbi:ARMT1-like domain-containing protein [Leptothoe sp. PORK10 BA2]|uniref:ARMT1-like domain-containing protein n=1 Tax=Leptothoe sp. PORK10 BA2 TaxID=3110254 RepID=UPI003FA3A1E1